jgi:hypothetical protein
MLTGHFDQAEHTSVVRALWDYEASDPGELSVKKDDALLAFDQEDGWLLVQGEKDQKAGYIPASYVEVRLLCYVYVFTPCIPIAFDLRLWLNQWVTRRPDSPPRRP